MGERSADHQHGAANRVAEHVQLFAVVLTPTTSAQTLRELFHGFPGRRHVTEQRQRRRVNSLPELRIIEQKRFRLWIEHERGNFMCCAVKPPALAGGYKALLFYRSSSRM